MIVCFAKINIKPISSKRWCSYKALFGIKKFVEISRIILQNLKYIPTYFWKHMDMVKVRVPANPLENYR
jgi:hypothetical protein